MKMIRVDFNSIDADGLTFACAEDSKHRMFKNDMVLALDDEGNSCLATVVHLGANGTIHMVIDPALWREELVPA